MKLQLLQQMNPKSRNSAVKTNKRLRPELTAREPVEQPYCSRKLSEDKSTKHNSNERWETENPEAKQLQIKTIPYQGTKP
ncbi:hypothetical protein Tco_0054758 [Tanacetum coccineum]